ncbi:hypothetical protein [Naasia lichenicola]|uniref:Uncharacterized protein n=1 Tax=Naasia lichenicola TaxID=2565933 RepID=A0A4S4FSH4_9MICO|nr:hypothetical protein [Naasia lichenicola]THG33251.1 hypothetical protein E6C64_02555 [Naasia lichenicola]
MTRSPESGPTMRPDRVDAIEAMLLENVRTSPQTESHTRRRRIAIVSVLAGSLVLAGTTAGAVLLNGQTVTDKTIVQCASSAERNADGSLPGSASAISADSVGAGRIDDAIAVCSDMWRQGVLQPGFDPVATPNGSGTVPDDLTVCVMSDGSAAVVPGRAGICESIGLAPIEP